MTPTRASTALLGTFASPTAIAAAGSSTATALDLSTNVSTVPAVSGEITAVVIIGGTPPTTAPTIQFRDYVDGTNPEVTQTYVCPNAASTRYVYPYAPLETSVKKFDCVITNGATTGITAYVVGNAVQYV